MCGIAGVITSGEGATGGWPVLISQRHGQDARGTLESVEQMVALQHHRGPDHAAVVTLEHPRGRVVLGHNRLAVLDLSPSAHQPMPSADGRFCISYNGEIYNYRELRGELAALGYRFRTSGDTEVILAAFDRWGTEVVGRLNGMFAFALFDRQEGRLFLVRDRFGIKPLYYVLGDGSLHFASTERPLATILRLKPNLDYLATALRYWVFDHDEAAPYEGMKAVPPGHLLEVRLPPAGGLQTRLHRYYDLEHRVADVAETIVGRTEGELTRQATELLDDAVRLRLRSDVPLAVSLSGGLDSGAIAAVAAGHQAGQLHAFTFGRPEVRRSEGPLVARLARRTGIDVHYVWPDDRAIAEALVAALDAQGSPIVNTSVVAQHLVFEAAHRQGFKVMLGGQGGDEVFMGYRKYQVFALAEAARRGDLARAAWQLLWTIPTLATELPAAGHYWRHRGRYTRRQGIESVLRLPEPEPLPLGRGPAESLGARALRDVTLVSLPSLLRYEDRNSMAHSVESRLPLLDYRLVELGLALPAAMKVRRGWGKWILRRAIGPRLPRAIRWARYKHGFSVPQNAWIDRGLGCLIRRMLRRRRVAVRAWLSGGASLDELFSDERLKHRGATLAEATALLWLVGHEPTETTDIERPFSNRETVFAEASR